MGERRGARHVVLVGLMGSGKSTVGRKVAARLERPFVDTDEELAARTGRSVRDWFTEAGEEGFRDAEAALLTDLLAARQPTVIAAGGGVVVRAENRAALGAALVVWLDADPTFLASRVSRRDHRPLIDDDPEGTLARLHADRSDWYREVADEVVAVDPVHASAERPKRVLADIVTGLVRAAEARVREARA